MPGKHVPAVRIDLDEPAGPHPGPLEAKVDPSDAGEETAD